MSIPTAEELKAKKERERDKKKRGLMLSPKQVAFTQQQLARLTQKQKNFLRTFVENPTMATLEVARRAGYSIKAGSRASSIVKSIQGKLGPVFHECFGITEYELVETMVEARQAMKTQVVVKKEYDNKGNTVSEEIVRIESPDWPSRMSAVRMMTKLGGYEPASKLSVDHTGSISHDFAAKMTLAEMEEREAELTEVTADYEVEDVREAG